LTPLIGDDDIQPRKTIPVAVKAMIVNTLAAAILNMKIVGLSNLSG
jgi:hypothetical protein